MPEAPLKSPWVGRASRWQIAAVAILLGMATWLLLSGADIVGIAAQGAGGAIAMGTVNALVGVLMGLLALRNLLLAQARHERIVRNLETISEMNHHIRNALVRLQLAAYLSDNEEIISHIRESLERIDWALREVLRGSGDKRE